MQGPFVFRVLSTLFKVGSHGAVGRAEFTLLQPALPSQRRTKVEEILGHPEVGAPTSAPCLSSPFLAPELPQHPLPPPPTDHHLTYRGLFEVRRGLRVSGV